MTTVDRRQYYDKPWTMTMTGTSMNDEYGSSSKHNDVSENEKFQSSNKKSTAQDLERYEEYNEKYVVPLYSSAVPVDYVSNTINPMDKLVDNDNTKKQPKRRQITDDVGEIKRMKYSVAAVPAVRDADLPRLTAKFKKSPYRPVSASIDGTIKLNGKNELMTTTMTDRSIDDYYRNSGEEVDEVVFDTASGWNDDNDDAEAVSTVNDLSDSKTVSTDTSDTSVIEAIASASTDDVFDASEDVFEIIADNIVISIAVPAAAAAVVMEDDDYDDCDTSGKDSGIDEDVQKEQEQEQENAERFVDDDDNDSYTSGNDSDIDDYVKEQEQEQEEEEAERVEDEDDDFSDTSGKDSGVDEYVKEEEENAERVVDDDDDDSYTSGNDSDIDDYVKEQEQEQEEEEKEEENAERIAADQFLVSTQSRCKINTRSRAERVPSEKTDPYRISMAAPTMVDDSNTVHQCTFVTDTSLPGARMYNDISEIMLLQESKDLNKLFTKTFRKSLVQRNSAGHVPRRTLAYMRRIDEFTIKNPFIFFGIEAYKQFEAPVGMVNLYDALKTIEQELGRDPIRFVKSNFGSTLAEYTKFGDKTWDITHTRSNQPGDLLRYPIRYGLVSSAYAVDLANIVKQLLMVDSHKTNAKNNYSRNRQYERGNIQRLNAVYRKTPFDFIEGELELLAHTYWSMDTMDLLTYNERRVRSLSKQLLFYLYTRLRTSETFSRCRSDVIKTFSRQLNVYANFTYNMERVSTRCVAFLKENLKTVWFAVSQKDYRLWGTFFQRLKVCHYADEHCVHELLNRFDDAASNLEAMTDSIKSVYRLVTESEGPQEVSVWASKMVSKIQVKTVFKAEHVSTMFPRIFASSSTVEQILLVSIDNFVYYHVFLMSKYIANYLSKTKKKTHRVVCYELRWFFKQQCSPKVYEQYHSCYAEPITSCCTKELKKSVLVAVRFLVRSVHLSTVEDSGQRLTNVSGFDDGVFEMFFDWIRRRIDYAVYPALYWYSGESLTPKAWAIALARSLDKHVTFLNENTSLYDLRSEEIYNLVDDKDYIVSGDDDDYFSDSSNETDYIQNPTLSATKPCAYMDCDEDFEENFDDDDFENEELSVDETRLSDELKLLMDDVDHDWLNFSDDDDVDDVRESDAVQRRNDRRSKYAIKKQSKYKILECDQDLLHYKIINGFRCFGTVIGDSETLKKVNKCSLCAFRRITSNMVVGDANVLVVRSCLQCISKLNCLIQKTTRTYKELKTMIVKRVDGFCKPPLLFDKRHDIIDEMATPIKDINRTKEPLNLVDSFFFSL